MTTIKDILGKQEITIYDAVALIEKFASVIKDNKMSPFHRISEDARGDFDNLATGISKFLVNYEKAGDDALNKAEEIWTKIEERVSDLERRRSTLEARIRKLGDLKLPHIQIPYQWEDMCSMATRLSQMTEDESDALLWLVRAIQDKNEKETAKCKT